MFVKMKIALVLAAITFWVLSPVSAEEAVSGERTLRVMSFNIWANGRAGKQPLSQTVKVIQESKADIVGLQEANAKTSATIAGMLGWHQSGSIISSYEIVGKKRNGAKIRLGTGQEIFVFNEHFRPAPYQPYQLLKIPYGNGKFITSEKEAIEEAKKARGHELAALMKEVGSLAEKDLPIFLTGDFNEPSHLDWTEKAAEAGRHPVKVDYPVSRSLSEAGFVDAYRAVHSDEMKFPGYTWTPITESSNPKDHHDRIDFVMVRGKGVKVKDAKILGENKENADIVVAPYPSDHRAVVATFEITGAKDQIDAIQQEEALLVMRATVKEPGSGSKYIWTEVEPIKILKSPKGFSFPKPFKVAGLSFSHDLPIGEMTLYLVPYNLKGPPKHWKLLQKYDRVEKTYTKGFSHHKPVN